MLSLSTTFKTLGEVRNEGDILEVVRWWDGVVHPTALSGINLLELNSSAGEKDSTSISMHFAND